MKIKITLFLLVTIFTQKTYSQVSTTSYSELKNKVFSFAELKSFIESEFVSAAYTKIQLRESNHPVELYRFNRIRKPSYSPFSLLGINVTNIYAYKKDDEHFCLYILLPINNRNQVDQLSDELGRPWNITADDYDRGSYSSLMWQHDRLETVLMKNFDYSNPDGGNLLLITNIPLKDLVNNDPW